MRRRRSGFQVKKYLVELYSKLSFPLGNLIMVLVAIPFAVNSPRSGRLFGVGLAIVILAGYLTVHYMAMSFARADRQGLDVVGEINGRVGTRDHDTPIGTESRSVLRAGSRFTRGTVRVDGAILVGLTSRDTTFGFTAGATWVFRGFTVP